MKHYLNRSLLLLLYGFGCIQASEGEVFGIDEYFKQEKKEAYKKYFKEEEQFYQELLSLGISGARPLNIDEVLAEAILATCPQEIKDTISSIEQGVFCDNEKNIILHGISGTGKSCLAQAIAIKSQTPCLYFNAGGISTQYMNSGVQNLNRIFQYAEMLQKVLGKPCIIIFDGLEALTTKHADKNNHENNILASFWQELDQHSNSKVVVIGIMNGTEGLPVQIINRTSMIEVPLPKLEHREAILFYYLKAKKDKYKLLYPESISAIAKNIALQTEGFSNRDLQNLVTRVTKPVILEPALPDRINKVIMSDFFDDAIEQIKNDPKWKVERQIGTWKDTFKTYCPNMSTFVYIISAALLVISYKTLSVETEIMMQIKKIADYQTSIEHMTR